MKEKYKKSPVFPAAIVALFALVVYYPVLNAHFVNLDDIEVVSSLFDSNGSINLSSLYFRDNVGRYYRPLVISSLIIDFNIWQLEPSGYHLTNYLLHAVNALLFYFILSRLQGIFNYRKQAVTTGCALLFALHPLTCESVAWISGRSDIIASFFCLAGFCYYIYDYRYQSFVVPLCLLLGLWAKENAIVLIPILLITDFVLIKYKTDDSRRAARSVFKWTVIFIIPLLIYFYMRMGGLSQLDHGIKMSLADKTNNVVNPAVNRLHTVNYLINMAAACGFYLKKLFIPFPLNFAIVNIALIPYLVLFLLLSLLGFVLFFLRKPWFLFWLGLLIISFSPALLIATSKMAWMPFAERYLYLSCPVWAAAIFFAVNSWISRKQHERYVVILLTIIVCAWSVTTFNRISAWQDDKSLWTATRHDSPDSAKVMFKYASVLSSRGQGKEARELLEEAAEKIDDIAWKSYILLALADKAAQDKETDKAADLIKQAFAAQHNIYTYQAMANSLLNNRADNEEASRENKKKAAEYFRVLYGIKPDPFYLYQIVKIYNKEDTRLAKSIYQEIIASHPRSKYAAFSEKILDRNYRHGAAGLP